MEFQLQVGFLVPSTLSEEGPEQQDYVKGVLQRFHGENKNVVFAPYNIGLVLN